MPAMQVRYGNWAAAAGACRFGVRQAAVLDARGAPYMYDFDVDVAGRLYGEGDGFLSAAEVLMRNALSRPFQDFGVLRTNGTPSGSYWRNSQTVGGIVIHDLNFQGTAATEYVFFREFTFTAKFRLPLTTTANAIVEFHESVEFTGGEPEFVFKRAMNALPQKQLVWFATEYRVTQSGKAVGFLDYPPAARLLFPGDKVTAPRVVKDNPQRVGDGFIHYPVTWQYSFASAAPMIALPNVWPG